jgi:hypothetical protein
MSQMKWLANVMNVGLVKDKGLLLDMEVNTRLSKVCGLAARQRESLTLQGFNDLAENEKDKLFETSIQAYVQYMEELKQKGRKVALKIISYARRSYKSKLVKLSRKNESPFTTYRELREED